jgi:hypothetical protein
MALLSALGGQLNRRRLITAALVLLFLSLCSLRLIYLDKFPGAEWDESVYQCLAQNWRDLGEVLPKDDVDVIQGIKDSGGYWYHPPFYFVSLGEWFRLVGNDSLATARLFAAASNVLMLVLLLVLARRLLSTLCLAALAVLPVTVDAWLVLSARTAWFENQMMLLGVISLMLWHWAGEQPTCKRRLILYSVAGLVAGFTVDFKLVGIVFPLAMGIHWLTDTKKDWGERSIALNLSLVVVVVYHGYGLVVGRQNFIDHSLHQFFRATVRNSGGGVNFGLAEALQIILTSEYILFVPSIIMLGVAGIWLLKDIWDVTQGHKVTIVTGWIAASFLFFAAIKLRNPHYALMYLTPAAFYLGYKMVKSNSNWAGIIAVGYIVLNLMMLGARLHVPDNALAEARAYVSQNISSRELIVTEEAIGCGIPQDYLNIRLRKNRIPTNLEERSVEFVVFIESRTYKPIMEPEFQALIDNGEVLASFEDYKWIIHVVKIFN